MGGYQQYLGLGAPDNNRPARSRLPMKEDAPAPVDPDRPYLALYCILASCITSLSTPADLRAWITQNKPAFDALSAGSPERAGRLRQIYSLHLTSLSPHAVTASAEPPPPTPPAADLVDTILEGGGGDDE